MDQYTILGKTIVKIDEVMRIIRASIYAYFVDHISHYSHFWFEICFYILFMIYISAHMDIIYL